MTTRLSDDQNMANFNAVAAFVRARGAQEATIEGHGAQIYDLREPGEGGEAGMNLRVIFHDSGTVEILEHAVGEPSGFKLADNKGGAVRFIFEGETPIGKRPVSGVNTQAREYVREATLSEIAQKVVAPVPQPA